MSEDGQKFLRYAEKRLIKEAMKEAMKEWLNEQFSTFGKWSVAGILSLALTAVMYLFLISQGWRK